MGKNRVKGIVVEIGGDTVKLDKALQGTNKHLEGTQKSLKDVERLLKLDPKNTVLLQQKQKLLASAIADTEENLQQLTEANRQAVASAKNYDAWQAAYEPIQAEIDKTSKQLAKLEKANREAVRAGEVNTEGYDKLQEEIKDTREHLKELKTQADAVYDQFGRPLSPEQFDALQREIIETEHNLKDLSDRADRTRNQLNELEGETRDVADAMDEASKETSTFGDVLKAEAIVEGAKAVADALRDVTEETKEYRKIMGTLETSSEAAGYTAEQTQEAYKRLVGVLGDEQSAATALANLQALGLSQEHLLKMCDLAIGGWARFGDSIPIDSLAESINETAKTGKVTGTLADILNWGAAEGENYGQMLKDLTELERLYQEATEEGRRVEDFQIEQIQEKLGLEDVWDKSVTEMTESQEKQIAKLKALIDAGNDWNETIVNSTTAEDIFNIALQQTTSEAERADLIMRTLTNQGLSDMASKWRENNASMVESNETSADLREQLAELGEVIEPMLTQITALVVDFLKWFNSLDENTQKFIIKAVALVAVLGPLCSGISNVVKMLSGDSGKGLAKILDILSGEKLPGLGTALSTIGTKAIPALTGAVGKGFGWITGTALPGLSGAFSAVFSFIAANPIVLLIAAIVGLVALVAAKGDEAQAGLQKIDDWLQNVFAKDWTEVFGPKLGGVLNGFMDFFKGIWDAMKKNLDGVIDFIRGVFSGDWERAWKGVVELFESVFDGFVAIFKTPLNGVIAMTNKAIAGMNWLIDKANDIPGVDIGWRIPEIPMLANGGQVLQGSAIVGDGGPELLTVTGGRAIVQPLGGNSYHHNTSLGGVVVNVYAAPGQSTEEIADYALEKLRYTYDCEVTNR